MASPNSCIDIEHRLCTLKPDPGDDTKNTITMRKKLEVDIKFEEFELQVRVNAGLLDMGPPPIQLVSCPETGR